MRGPTTALGWQAARLVAMLVFCASALPPVAYANGVDVPIALQVSLLGRIAPYDRTLATRARGVLRVMVVARVGNGLSERVAGQIEAQLRQSSPMAGMPVEVLRHGFTTSPALLDAATTARVGIVYFGPGLSGELPRLATALAGREILTVSAVGADADSGAVLSFELEESRPRIVVNLGQARRQRLQISSQLLRLSRVIP